MPQTNSPFDVDVIVVGQGLAGTTLAWCLMEAGQRVLCIDADEEVTSSKIAAGLITPITGQQLALSWRVDDFLPIARAFYTRIEQRTGRRFFYERTATRLFASDVERARWPKRLLDDAYQAHLVTPQPVPLLEPALVDTAGGGFAMHSAQLDVAAYLEASRTVITAGCSGEHANAIAYEKSALDWQRDVELSPDGVTVLGRRARMVVSCEGYAAARNPYFAWVPFKGAKGDVLTVRFDGELPPQPLHRGIWIAPTAEARVFRVGSTYDWAALDHVPSPSARSDLEAKLRQFVHVPYEVLDHQAAVRPIIQASKAVIGVHPTHERLGYFNGLGSKGSLLAPSFAQRLAERIVVGTPVPESVDVRKYAGSLDDV